MPDVLRKDLWKLAVPEPPCLHDLEAHRPAWTSCNLVEQCVLGKKKKIKVTNTVASRRRRRRELFPEMEIEMDSSGKEGEVSVVRKSGHKGEAEDEAGKRRKIDSEGFAELQRVEGTEDAEKMEMDEIKEREEVPKRDLYAADEKERRVKVVLADWRCTVRADESEKGGVGCQEAKMRSNAEFWRTEGEGHHDSCNLQMEVEELFLHREAAENTDHKMEVGGEAVKILELETVKMDKTRECEVSQMDATAEERKGI